MVARVAARVVGTPRIDPAGDDLRDVLDLSRSASGKFPEGDFAVERKDVRREEGVVERKRPGRSRRQPLTGVVIPEGRPTLSPSHPAPLAQGRLCILVFELSGLPPAGIPERLDILQAHLPAHDRDRVPTLSLAEADLDLRALDPEDAPPDCMLAALEDVIVVCPVLGEASVVAPHHVLGDARYCVLRGSRHQCTPAPASPDHPLSLMLLTSSGR